MKLQMAVDIATLDEIMVMADQIHDIIDIFEIGTPIVIREGMEPVKRLKKKYPDLIVLADTKIADGGAMECRDVCEAGADIVTVLAFADNETLKEVTDMAHQYGKLAMADLLSINNIAKRAKEVEELGIDIICVHTGVDMQKSGRTPFLDLKELQTVIQSKKTAVAGGINMKNIVAYRELKPEIIISGSALYKAADLRKAVKEMKVKLM